MALVRETPLRNFTSAQDRRTLSTAQSCLDSLSIREAHANTVEETVKQKQLTLLYWLGCVIFDGVSRRAWVRPWCCTIVSSERGCDIGIGFTLSAVSQLHSSWPSAPHGRVPTDVVVVKFVNSLHEYLHCEGVLCRKAPQCDLRDPGRSCSVVFLVCFLLCLMCKIF